MDVNVILSSVMAIVFCLIEIGIHWEDVTFLLLKCHCGVISLKWKYGGILCFMNIQVKMVAF